MRILIVVPNFIPEIGCASHTFFDLAKGFQKRGHEVDVITSYPREFYLDESDRSREFPLDETIEGILVHRVRHANTRDNIIFRGLEHFLIPGYYFKKYRELKKKFDICLFYIPPLPLYYLAKRIKRYDGTLSILNFQDFHPQELTDVGVLKNPLLIKILEYIERKAYSRADYITVLSHGGIQYVVQRGGNPEKISHIYNGILLSDCKQFFTVQDFKKKEGIEGKFLVTYAGILSPFQGIDNILDAAKLLIDQGDIVFYLVGDGMIKDHLARRIRNERLTNVKLMPLQPRPEYYNIINSSDINLISLDERMKAPCVPGKTINVFAAGRAVIAIVADDSETAYIMNQINADLVIQPGNSAALKDMVLRLKNNEKLRTDAGMKQKQFFLDRMTLEGNVLVYEKIMQQLIQRSSGEETYPK